MLGTPLFAGVGARHREDQMPVPEGLLDHDGQEPFAFAGAEQPDGRAVRVAVVLPAG